MKAFEEPENHPHPASFIRAFEATISWGRDKIEGVRSGLTMPMLKAESGRLSSGNDAAKNGNLLAQKGLETRFGKMYTEAKKGHTDWLVRHLN
ncbi:MAG TPA: hypothetical protein VMU43_10725 [Candidatus Acidoferrum sp.]|nr:hypothetical protein [Candidatus Acidoferrum sp.]